MRPIVLLLCLAFAILQACSSGKPPKYEGVWYRVYPSGDSEIGINIHRETSEFEVAPNQLSLVCNNKYRKDTLLLYVKSFDCGRDFSLMFESPGINTLFAKCYIKRDQLCVLFNAETVKKYFRVLQLDTVFYKADEDKSGR